MSIKDSTKKSRVGGTVNLIFGWICALIFFSAGAFMLLLGFFGQGDPTVRERINAVLIGLAFCGMALVVIYFSRRSSRECPRAVAKQIGVPDSVQHVGAGQTTNIANALHGQEPPKGAAVIAAKPMWVSWLGLIVASAMGAGLLYLGWYIEAIIPEWSRWIGYLFMGIGAFLLLGGLSPNNWRKRLLGFIAVSKGIYVHGQGVYPDGHERPTPETAWLFVPWGNVVDVREGLAFKGGSQGARWWPATKLTLRVTPDEAREWFPFAESEPGDDGMTRIVSLDYSDSDPSPNETVARLQQVLASCA